MLRRLRLFIAIFLATAFAAPAPAQTQWRRIDSPNFIIIGEAGGANLRDLAVRFEGFREMLGRMLNARVTATPVPTVVVAFAYDRSFTPFKPLYRGKRVETAGLFLPRHNVNYIALRNDANNERMRVVFHEYAHLIIENTGTRRPLWLDEGLAEYYTAFDMTQGGRQATLGGPIASHLALLNDNPLLSLNELISVDTKSPLYNEGYRRSVFYAQSWALTHMLLLGEPNREKMLAQYLDHLSKGMAPAAAWQEAFGPQDIIRELDQYVRRRQFKGFLFRFSDGLATFEAPVSSVSPAATQAFLADLLVESEQVEAGDQRLSAATKIDSHDPAVRVIAAKRAVARGELKDAANGLAALAPSSDWYLNYLAGVAVADLVDARGGKASTDDLSAARRFFAAARTSRPEFPNAAARVAALELQSDSGPTRDTRLALERARSVAPGRYDYAWFLAQLLAEQSEYTAARDVIEPLTTSRYPDHVREAAKKLMAQVLERQKRASTLRSEVVALPARREAPPPTPAPATTTSEPPVRVRPKFREIQSGEERFEGVLFRVECARDRSVTFHIRSSLNPVLITAPSLTAVEFLTYRDDVKGGIACGVVNPATSVYVTWKKGKTAGSRIAVAIEVLPK